MWLSQPKLCSDPVFLDSAADRSSAPATAISCQPVVSKLSDSLPVSTPVEPVPPAPQPVPAPGRVISPNIDTPAPVVKALKPADSTAAAPSAFKHEDRRDRPAAGEHDPLTGGLNDHYDPEMVTVYYDEFGGIKEAFTDDGEDITHEFVGYDDAHHYHDHHDHDHDHHYGHEHEHEHDHTRIVELQDLAKEMQHKIAAALTEAGLTANFDGHDGRPREPPRDADGRELPLYDIKKLTSEQLEDLLVSVSGTAGSGVVVELLGAEPQGERVAQAPPPPRPETEEEKEQARNRNAFKRMYEGEPVGVEGEGADRRRDEL